MIRRRVVVSGTVQGVGFRYSARLEADRLGVSGWVRNRDDGTVEAEVEGDEESVVALLDWLALGPPGATVRELRVEELAVTGEPGFRVIG